MLAITGSVNDMLYRVLNSPATTQIVAEFGQTPAADNVDIPELTYDYSILEESTYSWLSFDPSTRTISVGEITDPTFVGGEFTLTYRATVSGICYGATCTARPTAYLDVPFKVTIFSYTASPLTT